MITRKSEIFLTLLILLLALGSTVYADEKGKTLSLVENLSIDSFTTYSAPVLRVDNYKNISFLAHKEGPTDGDFVYIIFQFISDNNVLPSGGPVFYCPIKSSYIEPCFISGDPDTKFTAPYPVTGPYLKIQISNESLDLGASVSVVLYGNK